MPVTVVVRSASGEAPSLTFDGGRIVIGRSDGSDVRLPDPSVSLRHASIRAQGAEFTIVDEGSSNGTRVGGVRLGPHTPRLLRSGDLVRVGRVWLELVIGSARPATPDLGLATRDLALALVRNAMAAVGDDTQAIVRVTEGADIGASMPLVVDGRAYVLGRAETCDLPLADEDASREHAAVTRRGAQVFLRDLGSRNGVYLGDMRIGERDTVWRPPTMARIGRSVLALDEPVSLALAELEAADDEPVSEAEAPPPPDLPPAPAPPPAPESQRLEAAPAPIAEVAAQRNAPTYVKKRKRVWTAADILVVTIAVAVISTSLAGLVWVLRC